MQVSGASNAANAAAAEFKVAGSFYKGPGPSLGAQMKTGAESADQNAKMAAQAKSQLLSAAELASIESKRLNPESEEGRMSPNPQDMAFEKFNPAMARMLSEQESPVSRMMGNDKAKYSTSGYVTAAQAGMNAAG